MGPLKEIEVSSEEGSIFQLPEYILCAKFMPVTLMHDIFVCDMSQEEIEVSMEFIELPIRMIVIKK